MKSTLDNTVCGNGLKAFTEVFEGLALGTGIAFLAFGYRSSSGHAVLAL
jgi:hypothetical protein